MSSVYEVGRFKARVTDYGISETLGGDPQIFVVFDVDFSTGLTPMTWYGTLKEGKGRDITLKALLTLNMQGNDIGALLDGKDGGAIPLGSEASIVTAENEYNGKTSVRIAWVNSADGGAAVQRVDKATGLAALAKLNLTGDLLRLRATSPAPVPAKDPNSDVPFD